MKLYDLVKRLLERFPSLRDSDKELIWVVWDWRGLVGDSIFENINKYIRYDDYINAPSTESIRRCRQKIQELHPELKGSKRIERERKRIEKQRSTHIFRELI